MSRLLGSTRYLVFVPILGLALAAGVFFVIGGFQLISLIVTALVEYVSGTYVPPHGDEVPFMIQVVEHVHAFLIGTVLYITAVGFYQLFIQKIEFHGWLRVDSTEELEMNLIGVTIVVLAVNFLTVIFTRDTQALLEYGAGIALPIIALALYVGMRTWSTHLSKKDSKSEDTD